MQSPSTTRALLACTLLIAASLLAFAPGVREITMAALNWVEHLGPWGPAVLAVVYFTATVGMIPGAFLTLGAGAAFGLWTGLLAVVIGSNLGAIVAFLLGRTLLRGWTDRVVARSPRFAALDIAVAKSGIRIVVLTRLSPLLPFNLLNYAFGLTRLSLRDYAAASAIGMLPGTLLFVYIGATAKNLAEIEHLGDSNYGSQIVFIGGLLATVILTFYVTRIVQTALAQEPLACLVESVADEGSRAPLLIALLMVEPHRISNDIELNDLAQLAIKFVRWLPDE